ncbi:MAG: hypothetical protein U0836_06530 [Pirellulales bacterium]
MNSAFVGYYRGMGMHAGLSWTGRRWFHVRVDEGAQGWWEVTFSGYGYAPYRGYYANGKLKEEGVCLVEENGTIGEPLPDRHRIVEGRYFDPTGRLASKVSRGTGRQILFYADGTKSWDLQLQDGHRVQMKMYWPTGKLASFERYASDDRVDGPAYGNHSDGSPRTRGRYVNGERNGIWYRFFEDGSVKAIEHYDPAPAATEEFARGQKRLSEAEMSALEGEFHRASRTP